MAGKLFVIIGAGGAGKALAYGAKEKGARVVIANRTYGSSTLYFLKFCLAHDHEVLHTMPSTSILVLNVNHVTSY